MWLLCICSKEKNDCHDKEAKIKLDIDGFIKVRNSYPYKPVIGYLNINTLQNKIISLREIIAKAPLDVFCLDETKLDDSFRDSQFVLEHFQFPSFHRDQNSKGGGKLVYVKQGIIAKRLENLETNFSVTVCIELFPRKNGTHNCYSLTSQKAFKRPLFVKLVWVAVISQLPQFLDRHLSNHLQRL